MKSVRIGAAQAFYGDKIRPALELAKSGNVEYLCFDCLSELTLAILQKDRQRDPAMGYTRDIVPAMKALLPVCLAKGIKLITNAGGIHAQGAAAAVARVANELGLKVKIATVIGDDVLGRVAQWHQGGETQPMPGSSDPLSGKPALSFANAYLGAQPILDALKDGADIVITGRTTDTAQYLAAAAHALDWKLDDLDRAAQGLVAGHLLECTAQVTGGNFSGRWWEVEGLENIGYPLVDVYEDGTFVIGKLDGSGGLVSVDTVREQLLYEIHDPSSFISPDAIVDMTTILLEDVGPNRVRVSGAKGRAKPTHLKVVGGYPNGFVGEGRMVYTWPDAYPKAKKAEQLLRAAIADEGITPDEVRAEFFGVNAIHEANAQPPVGEPTEVVLRVAVRTKTKGEAAKVGRLFPPLAIGGPPHVTGLSGISDARELMGVASFLIRRELVESGVEVQTNELVAA